MIINYLVFTSKKGAELSEESDTGKKMCLVLRSMDKKLISAY
jgi:hypothetical protein